MSKVATEMNVYAQLGFPDAEEMLVEGIYPRSVRYSASADGATRAAKVLGLTQPKLSKMLRGQFRGISK